MQSEAREPPMSGVPAIRVAVPSSVMLTEAQGVARLSHQKINIAVTGLIPMCPNQLGQALGFSAGCRDLQLGEQAIQFFVVLLALIDGLSMAPAAERSR